MTWTAVVLQSEIMLHVARGRVAHGAHHVRLPGEAAHHVFAIDRSREVVLPANRERRAIVDRHHLGHGRLRNDASVAGDVQDVDLLAPQHAAEFRRVPEDVAHRGAEALFHGDPPAAVEPAGEERLVFREADEGEVDGGVYLAQAFEEAEDVTPHA